MEDRLTWLDESFAQYEKIKSSQQALLLNAEIVFANLWRQIGKVIDAATAKGMHLNTSGGNRERLVIMTLPKSTPYEVNQRYRRLTLTLSENLRTVLAASDAGEEMFDMKVSADGAVCLAHGGNAVDIQEAARLILRPFLFDGNSPFRIAP